MWLCIILGLPGKIALHVFPSKLQFLLCYEGSENNKK